MNVKDALSYLDDIKRQCELEVYDQFLDLMQQFKSQLYAKFFFLAIHFDLFCCDIVGSTLPASLNALPTSSTAIENSLKDSTYSFRLYTASTPIATIPSL
jgi:hypothetical protein